MTVNNLPEKGQNTLTYNKCLSVRNDDVDKSMCTNTRNDD